MCPCKQLQTLFSMYCIWICMGLASGMQRKRLGVLDKYAHVLFGRVRRCQKQLLHCMEFWRVCGSYEQTTNWGVLRGRGATFRFRYTVLIAGNARVYWKRGGPPRKRVPDLCMTRQKACQTRWSATKTTMIDIYTRLWERGGLMHVAPDQNEMVLHTNEIKKRVQKLPHAERTINQSAAHMKSPET